MNTESVNSIAFAGKTKTTKNGNEYKKTKAAKVTMGLIGAAGASATVYSSFNYIKKDNALKSIILNVCKQSYRSVCEKFSNLPNAKQPMAFKKYVKSSIGLGSVALIAASAGIFTGIGAIIDGIVNHHRAKKADKAAMAEQV